jgi:hypothetical protein
MKLFQSNYSLPELDGLPYEEKKRIIKASQTATWKNRKVWFSLVLLFLASGITNIVPKLIIFSSWYWRIESEQVRRVIIEISPWPIYVFALVFFCHAYRQAFYAAIRDCAAKLSKKLEC